jgi:hypothetical protein
MKAKKLTSKNFATNLNSNNDVVPVRGLHYNQIKDDFDAHIPSDGVGKFDSIGEYTSGNGVNIPGLTQDTIVEKTTATGVTVDGVLLKDGLVGKAVTATATTGGTGTAILTGADQFVTIVSDHANKIVVLPAVTGIVSAIIRGHVSSSGCEIRTNATGTYINNVNGDVESAIPADTTFKVEAVTATDWILTTTSNTGLAGTIVPDAV